MMQEEESSVSVVEPSFQVTRAHHSNGRRNREAQKNNDMEGQEVEKLTNEQVVKQYRELITEVEGN